MHVQFSDDSKKKIVTYFSSHQSSDDYDFLYEVSADDPRWIAYYESQDDEIRRCLPKPVYP